MFDNYENSINFVTIQINLTKKQTNKVQWNLVITNLARPWHRYFGEAFLKWSRKHRWKFIRYSHEFVIITLNLIIKLGVPQIRTSLLWIIVLVWNVLQMVSSYPEKRWILRILDKSVPSQNAAHTRPSMNCVFMQLVAIFIFSLA
jgi:hypothetical protein